LPVKLLNEGLLSDLHGLFELYVLGVASSLRGVPRRVVNSNSVRKVSVDRVRHVVSLIHSVIDCVDFHDEIFVKFLVNKLDFGILQIFFVKFKTHVLNDFSTVVFINESSRAQLGDNIWFCLLILTFLSHFLLHLSIFFFPPMSGESFLMMIKPLHLRIVNCTDIALDI